MAAKYANVLAIGLCFLSVVATVVSVVDVKAMFLALYGLALRSASGASFCRRHPVHCYGSTLFGILQTMV